MRRNVASNLKEERHMEATEILVVDDEPAFCGVMCEILRMYGFVPHQALSARHAMTILKDVTPELILTDIMMPDVDGLSLLRQVRADPALAKIPALVLTARCEKDQLQAALEAGADGYLKKPFSAQELLEVVVQYIDA